MQQVQAFIQAPEQEANDLLNSMVFALLAAVDEITPYNARHTKNMVYYAENFLAWLESTGENANLPIESKDAFIMCIRLHDVGKIAVPGEIMDKDSRLGTRIKAIQERFRVIELLCKLREERGEMTKQEHIETTAHLAKALDDIAFFNKKPLITDADVAQIEGIAKRTYVDEDYQRQPWLNHTEVEALKIRRGTLTPAERETIEKHVLETEFILSKVKFPYEYRKVPIWAKKHHEYLDGSGDPNHLLAENIPPEVRLLTILDIFEALTAEDRPYKHGMSAPKALKILHKMANDGKLDQDILQLFERSAAWE